MPSKSRVAQPSPPEPVAPDPDRELQRFVIEERPALYVIGTFDDGITVLRQQIRALNLGWALVETGRLSRDTGKPAKVAVVGAGFAGLTFAAALLEKQVNVEITLFEEHDTLLPLQQGSDTRWLHPRIYDWPDEGSTADVAELPVLNWTAARASDVVVQILKAWQKIVRQPLPVSLYCNVRHLQISKSASSHRKARLEWVGESRDPGTGATKPNDDSARGCAGTFDHVVLSVGFGIEDGQPSYWRNETLGQPNLHQRRRTHLVSGQGDGAMIDLLRVRVSQYRQDRILEEIFVDQAKLVDSLRSVKAAVEAGTGRCNLFDRFDALFGEDAASADAKIVIDKLARRLRRDTDAVLQLRPTVRDLAELLEPSTSRISFQNALLVYLLYRVGGFAPSTEDDRALCTRYAIPDELVIRRHGTKRMPQLERLLSAPLFNIIAKKREEDVGFGRQHADMLWPGGYFGYPGKTVDVPQLNDEELRSVWRKEYLPGPTALAASSICGAVVGAILDIRPDVVHLRVTLHRVLPLHREQLLQQACDYHGLGFEQPKSTAARTFPARNAMIGLAFRCRRPVRTRRGITKVQLEWAMEQLRLHDAARQMVPNISYILALPVLQPAGAYLPPSPVAAVLYLDSQDKDFSLEEAEIDRVARVTQFAFRGLVGEGGRPLPGVRNVATGRPLRDPPLPELAPEEVQDVIELLDAERAPALHRPFALNFDYADPASMEGTDMIEVASEERK